MISTTRITFPEVQDLIDRTDVAVQIRDERQVKYNFNELSKTVDELNKLIASSRQLEQTAFSGLNHIKEPIRQMARQEYIRALKTRRAAENYIKDIQLYRKEWLEEMQTKSDKRTEGKN